MCVWGGGWALSQLFDTPALALGAEWAKDDKDLASGDAGLVERFLARCVDVVRKGARINFNYLMGKHFVEHDCALTGCSWHGGGGGPDPAALLALTDTQLGKAPVTELRALWGAVNSTVAEMAKYVGEGRTGKLTACQLMRRLYCDPFGATLPVATLEADKRALVIQQLSSWNLLYRRVCLPQGAAALVSAAFGKQVDLRIRPETRVMTCVDANDVPLAEDDYALVLNEAPVQGMGCKLSVVEVGVNLLKRFTLNDGRDVDIGDVDGVAFPLLSVSKLCIKFDDPSAGRKRADAAAPSSTHFGSKANENRMVYNGANLYKLFGAEIVIDLSECAAQADVPSLPCTFEDCVCEVRDARSSSVTRVPYRRLAMVLVSDADIGSRNALVAAIRDRDGKLGHLVRESAQSVADAIRGADPAVAISHRYVCTCVCMRTRI